MAADRLAARDAVGRLERPRRVRGRAGRGRRRGRGPPRGPRPVAGRSLADALPDAARGRDRPPARRASAGCGSRSTCAAAASSRSRSGRRRSRSRAARSGRTAGSRPRSAGRRRSAPSARRSGTTRCRSSSRATGSSGRTARSASTASAGRGNKRTILAAEGLDPDGARGRGAARRAPHRLDDDEHRVLADVPPRAPGPGPLPGLVPLAARRRGRRATGRARSAARPRSRPPPDDGLAPGVAPSRNLAYRTSASRPRAATLRRTPAPGAVAAMTRPPANPIAIWVGHARALRRVGLDVPGHEGRHRHHAAVRDGRVPVRAGGPDPARSSSSPGTAAGSAGPRRPRVPRRVDRRRAAARRRDRARRVGRADDPDRHRRPAHRPGADVARDLRLRASSASGAAAASAVGHRRRPRRRRDPRLARRGDVGGLDPAGLARAHRVARCCWSLGSLYASQRAVLPAPALLASGVQMLAAGVALVAHRGADRRVGRRSTWPPSPTTSWAGSPTSSSSAASSATRTYAWLIARRAAVARRDVRLRQPGRRRDPRLRSSSRSRSRRGRSSPASSSSSPSR